MTFNVFAVDEWQAYAEEQMGTKRKIWFRSPDGGMYLFKYPRPNSGEAWAEKVAAEIAEAIHIPHAEVELAMFQGEQGTICKSFMTDPASDLFHGNQLLSIMHPGYDSKRNAGQVDHTYQRIMRIISALDTSAPHPCLTSDGVTCFAGYLTLDALIGNSDRHHENWALMLSFAREADGPMLVASSTLAPSFDHASCLGRELSDDQRRGLLADAQRLQYYFGRCRSRVYWDGEEQRQLHPIELVRRGYTESPELFEPWLDISVTMDDNTVYSLLDSLPSDWMSDEAREFAAALVRLNRSALEEVRKEAVT